METRERYMGVGGNIWVIEIWGVRLDVLLLKDAKKGCMAVLLECVDSSSFHGTGLIFP